MDWQSILYQYSMRITGNRWDAEDLAQDSIIKVMKAIHQDPVRPITKAYLYRIALNTWKDKQKKPRLHAEPLEMAHTASRADYSFVTRELLELLADRLPPRMVVILLLMDVFRLTAKETAELLDSREATVQVTLGRARARLKQYVQRYSMDESPPGAGKRPGQGRLDFEALVEAFRQHDPRAICQAYLRLANEGITLTQLQTKDGKLHFTFQDPDGNMFSIIS